MLDLVWPILLISMVVIPGLLGFLNWHRWLPGKFDLGWQILTVLPLAIWLLIIGAVLWVSVFDERSIPLRLGADTFALGKEAERQGVPVCIEMPSGEQGYIVHFDARYLTPATAMCAKYAR